MPLSQKPSIAILTGKLSRVDGRFSYGGASFASKLLTRQFESLTEGIISANVSAAGGSLPSVHSMSNPASLKDVHADIALVSINDLIALRYLVEKQDDIRCNFSVVYVGGQVPSLMPDTVRHFIHPEFNIVAGELEGHAGELLSSAGEGAKGALVRWAAPNLQNDYIPPIRDESMHYFMRFIELGRGCAYKCDFCPVSYTTPLRWRNPLQVIGELSYLLRIGARRVLFVDSNLWAYPENVLEPIFRFIHEKHMFWSGEASAREILGKPDLWDLASRSCISLLTGIEGLDGKYGNMKKNSAGILTSNHGCNIVFTYMVGAPGQTIEGMRNDLRHIRRQGWTVVPQLFTPYPGTGAFSEAVKNSQVIDWDLGHFDRKNTVINAGIPPEEMDLFFLEFNRRVHSLGGIVKSSAHAVFHSKRPNLAVSRWLSLVILQARAYYSGIPYGKISRDTPQGAQLILPHE